MLSMIPLLGALAERPTLLESITYQFTGLMVVFAALGTIWALVELIGLGFKRLTPAVAPLPPPPAASLAPVDALTPATAAVIAAAVHVVLQGQPHVVHAIVPTDTDPDWAREGRRQIFSSHQLR